MCLYFDKDLCLDIASGVLSWGLAGSIQSRMVEVDCSDYGGVPESWCFYAFVVSVVCLKIAAIVSTWGFLIDIFDYCYGHLFVALIMGWSPCHIHCCDEAVSIGV